MVIDTPTIRTGAASRRNVAHTVEELNRKAVREGAAAPADGARVPAGVDRRRRAAPGGAVRGPRHRRQGRRHQAHHRLPEPAHLPRRGASPRPASASARSGTSSATSRICRPPARSCCSTAAGTTAPGVEHVMGYCTTDQYEEFLRFCPLFEQALINDGIMLVEVLAVGQRRGAGAPLRETPVRSAQALEVQPHRPAGARPLGRLRRSQGPDVHLHRRRAQPLVCGRGRRQAHRAPEPHQPPAVGHPL